MSSILSLQEYGSDNSDESDHEKDECLSHLKPLSQPSVVEDVKKSLMPNMTPAVIEEERHRRRPIVDPTSKELSYNPRFEELYKPQSGPENPYLTQQQKALKNTLTGFVEPTNFNAFHFETQRKTMESYGFVVDPSVNRETGKDSTEILGNTDAYRESGGKTVFESKPKREGDKRKRQMNKDPSDIEGYLGPWGKYVDEETVSIPTEAEQKDLDEILSKRSKKSRHIQKKPDVHTDDEKCVVHLKETQDYQGRSFMAVPTDLPHNVNLKSDFPPDKCFIPKKLIHTWTGHTKGVQVIKLYPKYGHLLLSGGLDNKIKLWKMYQERSCIQTYMGHKQAVRDLCFSNDGKTFLSGSFDRTIKLWDTETGKVQSRFTNNKIPYCVKFNPDEDKQHMFVAGMSDKKMIQWDIRSGEIVQEYDRHLGSVNSITFIDHNRRIVSTSDDKSLRLWEWEIPVDFKYIADPSMHSMPSVTLSPNGKWLAAQSMDNQIVIFNVLNHMKWVRKKSFKGHMVAGYACSVDYSPDMTYLISGDADGRLFIWDWKTTKLYEKFKAHDGVCIQVLWHPHETSKVITCGWDNLIKLWD